MFSRLKVQLRWCHRKKTKPRSSYWKINEKRKIPTAENLRIVSQRKQWLKDLLCLLSFGQFQQLPVTNHPHASTSGCLVMHPGECSCWDRQIWSSAMINIMIELLSQWGSTLTAFTITSCSSVAVPHSFFFFSGQ